MLGISRGTLRSALRRLEERGEIVRRQGSGTFVGRSAVPAALGERLERLEPYSSLAERRGLTLSSQRRSHIERRAVGGEVGEALGLAPIAPATTVARTLMADEAPVAVMFDVVHPKVSLPERRRAAQRARAGPDGARRTHRPGRAGDVRSHARDPVAAQPARARRQAARGQADHRGARTRGADLRRPRRARGVLARPVRPRRARRDRDALARVDPTNPDRELPRRRVAGAARARRTRDNGA